MSLSAALIRPLYHLGENRLSLRGTHLRKTIFCTMEGLSRKQADAARHRFETARPSQTALPIDALPDMLERAAARKKPQRWDRRRPQDKAVLRAGEVTRSIGYPISGKRIIELACGDGRVAMHLARQGATVTGVDLSDHAMAPEAAKQVELLICDAASLGVADESVDAIYSFDAFEHFSDPAAVLAEAHRALKPGGVVYASFGPLWNSPFGAHQWGRIDLPYVHLLFDRAELDHFADTTGRPRITTSCNEKSIAYFRQMFADFDDRFERVSYIEKFNTSFNQFVREHAHRFRSQVDSFDELIVRSIEVVLRKRG